MVLLLALSRAANTCELPTGTESGGTDCDYGEGGCSLSVLKAYDMTCTPGYNGSPAKANAVCGSGMSESVGNLSLEPPLI